MAELSINAQFRESLECLICRDFYTPPILLCPYGHSICSVCATKAKKCPQCRSALNKHSRNKVLEGILEQVSIPCKFKGCTAVTTLFSRQEHYKSCIFNSLFNCIECCNTEEDLVSHLIAVHEYKEILMGTAGGLRSFSGPLESWARDTTWPKGVWRLGPEPLIVKAKSLSGVFHVFLYKLTKEQIRVTLTVESPDFSIEFTGLVPHIWEYLEKSSEPHFHCEVNLLLSNFVKVHEEDEDILRLWMNVKRKPDINPYT